MSSENKGALTVKKSAGALMGEEQRIIRSADDLFLLIEDNNTSALSHDIDADGWPDYSEEDLEDDAVQNTIFDLQDDIDVGDIDSVNRFGMITVQAIEQAYSRFNQSSVLAIGQLEQRNAQEDSERLNLDLTEMYKKLLPFFIEEEDLKPGFLGRLFGQKAEEKPSPDEVITSVERFSLDINRHQAEVYNAIRNKSRTISSIRNQKAGLERAMEEAEQAETKLFLAYYAGLLVLDEWLREDVREAYVNCPEFGEIDESKLPEDLAYDIPRTPSDWAAMTTALNQRLENFRHNFILFKKLQIDIPGYREIIDGRIIRFEQAMDRNMDEWKSNLERIRNAMDLIRVEQRMEILKERAQKLGAKKRANSQFAEKFEKADIATNDKFTSVAERTRSSIATFKEQSEAEGQRIMDDLNRLHEARNSIREKLGLKIYDEAPVEARQPMTGGQEPKKKRGFFG